MTCIYRADGVCLYTDKECSRVEGDVCDVWLGQFYEWTPEGFVRFNHKED